MRRIAVLIAAVPLALLAAPAEARRNDKAYVAPYIELGQVVTADLETDDVLTYSTVAAGVDAGVHTARTDVQLSYRYERRIAYQRDVRDSDVHSGLVRGGIKLAPGLTVEGGALATRVRSDIRGAAPGVLAGNVDNISQVYSLYAGPTYATHVGPVGVAASYRYGYTKAEAPQGVAPGGQRLDVFDHAESHVVNASAGVKAGAVLPVGVNVSGAYEHDAADQLDQTFDDVFGRADIVAPLLPTVALTAGVGYENLTVKQRDPLRDATGTPVADRNGRFRTDPASPARIAYETDGLIYDAGVIWRPSRRTTLTARVGRRYGGVTYLGSLSYAASQSTALQVGVYDSVETFGHQLREGIAALPTSFVEQRDAFSQQFSGCTFGSKGAAGGCLNGVFQSLSTSAYRARGVDAVFSERRGRLNLGLGGGYASRRFVAPAGTPYSIDGVTDQSYYAQAFANASLTRQSGVNGTVLFDYYDSGLANAAGVYSVAGTGTYYHYFGRLGASASAGIYSFSQQGTPDQVTATGQVGLRYQF